MARMPSPADIARTLADAMDALTFADPVTHTYNPLHYAWNVHRAYLDRYARPGIQVLLVGMNPGPWGMAQTGVPFGEVAAVRGWLGLEMPVGKPDNEHPKRRIQGFACTRSEVSGARLWGWARTRFGTPDHFFDHFFVHNYCPLAFMEASGRNFTPDKLPPAERAPLFKTCDAALHALANTLKPAFVIGVGGFAEARIRAALAGAPCTTGRILHPSPASPAANRGWQEKAEQELRDLGVALP
jgi:single-strand selective monofunctional uracil DNA glycosylase